MSSDDKDEIIALLRPAVERFRAPTWGRDEFFRAFFAGWYEPAGWSYDSIFWEAVNHTGHGWVNFTEWIDILNEAWERGDES